MKNNYLLPTDIYEEATRRLLELKRKRSALERNVARHPEGRIRVTVNKNGVQYYIRTDHKDKTGKYIPKSETKLIRAHLQKKYDLEVKKLLDTEISSLEKLIAKAKDNDRKIRTAYEKYPEAIKEQLLPIDISDEDFAKEWDAIPFESKPIYKTDKTQESAKGHLVRSKSELMIANTLFRLGIPYKYECPLKLASGQIIHPDFTVLNVKKRQVFYWEHRGMMDDRNYVKDTVERMRELQDSGVFLGDQLIITEESSTTPLQSPDVEAIITHYLH